MAKEMIRQGGRSARIQQEVHRAVNQLLKTTDRAAITLPMIAERAGVTPSTLYRRWGDLSQLLADVAVARMRPIAEPEDTGEMIGDLTAFIVQYAEDMSSKVGREMLTDVIGSYSGDASQKCCGYTLQHLETLNSRALARGEPGFDVRQVIDGVVAPVMYHILFNDREVSAGYCQSLIQRLFGGAADRHLIAE
ncbi:MAG: TetR/AcrR family transcriptional regulator C-terminal ligand-binding domain-containing protein [Pantoea sp.]|uniref:TetR family transcriptional regulator n=1 Tax=Pantoea brenneri TaxID=472694 RepID=A0AAX3J901_9GAMM|nr:MULTISPECIES: TetR/AcrR family transcriptional regulator [Pantoea]MBS6035172.1 TetR/AcrR family transcriptional regulator C-terminal ligand-binding domain-containing protein [Pantoea sp.]MDH2125175.1 TetR/AcrR family transcriptional regulator [Pantoea brenneri]VXC22578.1 TetR family transcriptional regulator [Pantoea brenneri]